MAENRDVKINIDIQTTTSQKATQALSAEITRLTDEINKLGQGAKKATPDVEGIPNTKGLWDSFKNSLGETNISFGKMVGAFTLGNIAANAFTSAVGALKDGIVEVWRDAQEFQKQLLAIETIMAPNQKVTAELTTKLNALAVAYGTTAATQAKIFYEILSAGVEDTADATKLLEQANILAVGGLADTAQTINLLTTIYNVYGKELATTADAADSLFKTVQIGKTTIPELSSSLGQALPIARQFGITLDEVGAILAQFTNAGISTSEAATLLNSLLAAIAKNGKDLGPTMNETAVQTDGLAIVLDRLKNKTNLSTQALFDLLGRSEAVRAAQILSKIGLENYNKVLDQYTEKTGVAAAASEKMQSEMGKQWDKLWQKTKNGLSGILLIDSVWLPLTKAAVTGINNMSDAFVKLEAEQNLRGVESSIQWINKALQEGKGDAEALKEELKRLEEFKVKAQATLSVVAPAPQAEKTNFWKEQKKDIESELELIRSGITSLPPIEQGVRVYELNQLLKEANGQIKQISLAGQNITGPVEAPASDKVDPKVEAEKRRREAILAERAKLQTELTEQQAVFEAGETLAAETSWISMMEEDSLQFEMQLAADAEHKQALIDAEFNHQIAMAELIKDAKNQKLAEQLADQQKQIAMQKLQQETDKKSNDYYIKEGKKEDADELKRDKALQKGKADVLAAGFNAAIAISEDGSKEQFLLQRASALSQAILAMLTGIAQANMVPPPGNIAAAMYAKTTGVLNIAAITASAFKGLADGGSTGNGLPSGKFHSASMRGDTNVVGVNGGEYVLNQREQRVVSDLMNSGGGMGNNSVIVELLSNINTNIGTPVYVSIDGTILTKELNRLNNLRLT